LDIGVLGYIGIVWPKEHSPEVWSVPPVTPCVSISTCSGQLCAKQQCLCDARYLLFCVDDCLVCRVEWNSDGHIVARN